ncbi:type II secretion system F family protein [Chlamydia muridarum str. Nigg]|jgi:Type II secretory pathway, component PulF|uniref:General secretion pathway protein GspF n=2 Tax=Chlamydia muridarum TaxID=83560 RepID=A0A070A324_CHLMR|nr:type II secretion system F family protein [Chlamydia muridarum]UFT54351.1 type II secretion system F family protein [Chlamydia trachomatis]AAF39655.1 general secretion pathway protein F [Chlamydia muridarum str. Nigg]AHH23245.1 general secretion pathway protein F [Chlamydia muridarum str. Nigg3 CMUT3-5]AHH24171.1 general secretion pathway protein F [Chlamydia muridarum str. Nigg CM972]AID38371.1 general secretion pathway protein GspF [Chlamydia muridarum str. Nigg 2 MCR]
MARFLCTYLDQKEKKRRSFVEAFHQQEARELLMSQGARILDIRKVRERNYRVPTSELVIFTKQLSLLLRSGVSLYDSLASLRDQYQGRALAGILTSLMEALRSGGVFSEALAKYPTIFDSFYQNSVRSGESVGNLEGALVNITKVLEEKEKLSKNISAALSYPAILLVFSCAVIVFFLVGVIPSLKESFEDIETTGLTKIVFSCSEWFCKYQFFLLIGGVIGGGAFRTIWKKQIGRKTIEGLVKNIPILRNFIIKIGFCRFCSVASAVLQGGGNLIEALKLGCGAIPQDFLREELQTVIQAVIRGGSLSRELSRYSWTPKLVTGMVALGEESGDLSVVFAHIAQIYNEDIQRVLAWLTAWCQPIVLVLLGGFIGLIMLSILLPLTSGIQTF